jgi:uncharacterized protein (TIGR03086 family)
VRDLIQHMFGTVNGCAAAVGGPPPGEVTIGPNVAQQFEQATEASLSVWRAPGVFDKTVDGGAGPMPARMLAGINQADIATHVWDLARATGQPAELPDDVAAAALETTKGFMSPEVRPGRFGDEVSVAGDSSPTDQLVAFLGRTP